MLFQWLRSDHVQQAQRKIEFKNNCNNVEETGVHKLLQELVIKLHALVLGLFQLVKDPMMTLITPPYP